MADKVPFPFVSPNSSFPQTYIDSWTKTPVDIQPKYVIIALLSALFYGSINVFLADYFLKRFSSTYNSLKRAKKFLWVNK